MTKLINASCNFTNGPTKRVESCVRPHVSSLKLLSEFKLPSFFVVCNNEVRMILFCIFTI